jgi:hypothetical protein
MKIIKGVRNYSHNKSWKYHDITRKLAIRLSLMHCDYSDLKWINIYFILELFLSIWTFEL